MIISASRRTDIPAFYSEWFMNRVRDGFLLTRNPFNAHQINRVSLNPKDVEAIIFWTRNPKNLISHIEELNHYKLNFCFLFTITGYPKIFEKNVPSPHEAIKTFKELSSIIGPDKVVWRYDPVLLSSLIDFNEHQRLFSKISDALRGSTNKVIISFADIYKKVETNLNRFSKNSNIEIHDICKTETELRELAEYFSQVSIRNGMQIQTCAENIDLNREGIVHGKCIDDLWLKNIFNINVNSKKDKGQRDECGCVKSIDIGAYNTCLHGCEYCYATFSEKSVTNNLKIHDKSSPFLIGGISEIDKSKFEIKTDGADPQLALFDKS